MLVRVLKKGQGDRKYFWEIKGCENIRRKNTGCEMNTCVFKQQVSKFYGCFCLSTKMSFTPKKPCLGASQKFEMHTLGVKLTLRGGGVNSLTLRIAFGFFVVPGQNLMMQDLR